jgi:hypothetical protein
LRDEYEGLEKKKGSFWGAGNAELAVQEAGAWIS